MPSRREIVRDELGYVTIAKLSPTLAPPSHFIYAHPAAVTTLTWAKFPVADSKGNLLLDQPTPYLISGGVDPTVVLHDLRDATAQVMIDRYLRCESIASVQLLTLTTCAQSRR